MPDNDIPIRGGQSGGCSPRSTTDNDSRLTRRELVQMGIAVTACAALGGSLWSSRKSFLREVTVGKQNYLRPPGAVPEPELLARCIRCNQCSDVCKNNCIQSVVGSAADGTPYIKPREKGCILCMNCTNVCPTGALKPISDRPEVILKKVKMGTAVVDKNICNSYNGGVCGVCIRACPFPEVALKTENWERPVVDKEHCVGCGLCENRCIVYPQAIRVVPRARNESST